MSYLIDGHNLIGQLPDISLDDPNDEAQLVEKLKGFVARTGKKCVVVFDHGIPGGTSTLGNRVVTVIFASAHRSDADRVMIERIERIRDTRRWIVVSSDQAVLSTARSRRIKTMTAHEFVSLLQRPSPLPAQPDVDTAPDVHVTGEALDEWMRLFGIEDE